LRHFIGALLKLLYGACVFKLHFDLVEEHCRCEKHKQGYEANDCNADSNLCGVVVCVTGHTVREASGDRHYSPNCRVDTREHSIKIEQQESLYVL
jgi:hypothetical protein